MTETLLLIRAGRTALHSASRMGGPADPPLDARGEHEVRVLATVLARFAPTRVATSPLQRAERTGCVIAWASNSDLTVDPRLVDRDDGQPFTVLHPKPKRDRAGVDRAPGVQSMAAVLARVRPALKELLAAEPGGVLTLVSHDVVIRALLRDLVPKQSSGLVVNTGSWSRLERENGRWRAAEVDRTALDARRPRQAVGHGWAPLST